MSDKICIDRITAHLDDVVRLSGDKLRAAAPHDDAPEDAYKLDACDTAMIREASERLRELQVATRAYLKATWGPASRNTELWAQHEALAPLVATEPLLLGGFTFDESGAPEASAPMGTFGKITLKMKPNGTLLARLTDSNHLPIEHLDEEVEVPRGVVEEMYRRFGPGK